MMPDSTNADAPERTPLKLVCALTTKTGSRIKLSKLGKNSELAPLVRLFQVETRTRRRFPVAFHVPGVKSATERELSAKGFTERSILLLCRQPDGRLDDALVKRKWSCRVPAAKPGCETCGFRSNVNTWIG